MIKFLRDYYKINRLKKLCLNPVFFAGCEMYRLLNDKTLCELAKKVKRGYVTLSSDLLFGRKIITTEEQFLYILNKYIVFIRNNCFINANELPIIIEETLKSKYSKILYKDLEFNINDNYKIYYKEFKKMFLDVLFNNFKNYYQDNINNDLIIKIKNMSLDNDEEVDELFNIFKDVISNRKDGLFDFFRNVKYGEQNTSFYIVKWKNLINNNMLIEKSI